MTIKKIPKQVGFVKSFDQLPIYYELRGTGEPVVFVYGIACLINHWNHQLNWFSKNFKTLAFDMRGHHRTNRPSTYDQISIQAISYDILALLNELKIEKAHFVGHSFGAQVIIECCKTFPERIATVTMINGFARSPLRSLFGVDALEHLFYFFKTQFYQNPELWKRLWKMGIKNPLSIPLTALAGGFNLNLTEFKDIEIYTNGVSNIDLGVFLRLFEDLMTYPGTDYLPLIKCPTLIISGENDKVTPQSFQLEMLRNIENSEFLLVPYGSHCTQLDFPEFTNLKIENFFSHHPIKE